MGGKQSKEKRRTAGEGVGRQPPAARTGKQDENFRNNQSQQFVPDNHGRFRKQEHVAHARPRIAQPNHDSSEAQKIQLKRMQLLLQKDPQMFILNNLLMTTQFFESFTKDKEKTKEWKRNEERKLDQVLRSQQKSCTLLGAMYAVVEKNVKYKANEDCLESFTPSPEFFIEYQNLDVLESPDSKVYERIDRPAPYKLVMDMESTKAEGQDETNSEMEKELALDQSNIVSETIPAPSVSSRPTLEPQEPEALNSQSPGRTSNRPGTPPPTRRESNDRIRKVSTGVLRPRPRKPAAEFQNAQAAIAEVDDVAKSEEAAAPPSMNHVAAFKRPRGSVGNVLYKPQMTHSATANGTLDPPRGGIAGLIMKTQLKKSGSLPSLAQEYLSVAGDSGRGSVDSSRRSSTGSLSQLIYESVPLTTYGTEITPHLPEQCFKEIIILEEGPLTKAYEDLRKVKKKFEALSARNFGYGFRSFFGYINEGFLGMETVNAYYYPPSIHTFAFVEKENFEKHRCFTPCLSLPDQFWPTYCNEWIYLRQRQATPDPTHPKGKKFVWPTVATLDTVKNTLGCKLIPQRVLRSKKKDKKQSQANEQWLISFAHIEDHLVSTFRYSQVRVLLFVYLIIKRYLQSERLKNMEEIAAVFRNLMFWMVEENAGDWPLEEAGRKTRDVLLAFFKCIKDDTDGPEKRYKKHFIQKSRDVLTAFPTEEKRRLQYVLSGLLQVGNPVESRRHLLHAMLNSLKALHFSDSFYPAFDCSQLAKVLTSKTQQLITIKTPGIPMAPRPSKQSLTVETTHRSKEEEEDKRMLWERRKEIQLQRQKTREEGNNTSSGPVTIELDFENMPHVPLTRLHWSIILPLFIRHFLLMAEQAMSKFKVPYLALLYLCQADNLAILLGDEGHMDEDEAKQYQFRFVEGLRPSSVEALGLGGLEGGLAGEVSGGSHPRWSRSRTSSTSVPPSPVTERPTGSTEVDGQDKFQNELTLQSVVLRTGSKRQKMMRASQKRTKKPGGKKKPKEKTEGRKKRRKKPKKDGDQDIQTRAEIHNPESSEVFASEPTTPVPQNDEDDDIITYL
ncbi:unnamed protein product [Cyprideis torosa]|uniref:Uncharacterized protein n=1 Tax=Cyprideis torosa TaxID=163714 RepID=A0A7R8ZM28_9CRUS|nr:unnamed protein product [Cyprideis torosa]CAG0888005.1 unnamed protein product [Cyprideis torosa]